MMKTYAVLACTAALVACADQGHEVDILPDVPEGAQAVSLMGSPFYPSSPYEATQQKYDSAMTRHLANPQDADALVWAGRWTAYNGDMRRAIQVFTEGIEQHPDDARFYRHRGHRYISIREFGRAIEDFERAAALIEGTEDVVEPDGQPNPQNIPVSTLHSNIWYHLGLAYYLSNDLENALRVYRIGVETSPNDDMLVGTTHWLYMTLRMLGRDDEAIAALEPIQAEMNVIENTYYHRLCLFYKGELEQNEVVGEPGSSIANDGAAYGIANWHLYNGNRDTARELYSQILEGEIWASFGFIAAEADWVREFQQ